MADLEMAGAPAEAPGTDGLTINDLPDDMIINIFSMMDIESLLVVSKVCTRWQQLCETPYVWKYARLFVDDQNFVTTKNIPPIVGKYIKNVKTYYIYDELKASLIKYCPNLTHLEIETWKLFISILDDLQHWPNLNFLNLDVHVISEPYGYSGYHMPFVANNLKTLEISYKCSPLANEFIATLIRSCSNLTNLKIYYSKVDTSIFDDLHLLPNLKFLSFNETRVVQDQQDRNSAYDLPFEKLKYLETLVMFDITLTRDSLYRMLECENLVSINIEPMRNIPADFLESLVITKQSTLRDLYIYGDTLNDDIMRHISNCTQLQVLFISECENLSDSSLLHLSRLKNLQTLQLFSKCKFSSSATVAYLTKNTFPHMKCLRIPLCFPVDAQLIDIINTNAPNLEQFYHDANYLDRKLLLKKKATE